MKMLILKYLLVLNKLSDLLNYLLVLANNSSWKVKKYYLLTN